MARTIVIVDDHAEFRAHAGELLRAAGYDVVASCADGASALAAVAAQRPDVVLLDVQLPDIDGFGVVERVEERSDGPIVVLTSTRDAADYGERIVRSGAAGFISKAELSAQSLDDVLVCRR